jgi:uncharacterized protein YkwD
LRSLFYSMTRYCIESIRTHQPARLLAASLLAFLAGGCSTDAVLTATPDSGIPALLQSGTQTATQTVTPSMASANPLGAIPAVQQPAASSEGLSATTQAPSAAETSDQHPTPMKLAETDSAEEVPSTAPATDDTASPTAGVADELQIDPVDAPEDTAEQVPPTLPEDAEAVCSSPDEHLRRRTLDLINTTRAEARFCGADYFMATGSVAWNDLLLQAARGHSQDMTQHNFFDHTGSDGGTIGTRVTSTGYRWSSVGENIAAGQQNVTMTLQSWIDSPGHCRNLMNPAFTDVAFACAEDDGSDYGRYWTNVLAAPR